MIKSNRVYVVYIQIEEEMCKGLGGHILVLVLNQCPSNLAANEQQ